MRIYSGPSQLDGQPIVALATGLTRKSANSKTGPMLQAYILRADEHPVHAVRTGADASVCGDCPLRPALANGGPQCYVNKGFGPAATYRAEHVDIDPIELGARARVRKLPIRLGAYGDPAAVPAIVWRELVQDNRWTGYTHQWRSAFDLRDLCMASVGSEAEAAEAHAAGWRTFRVRRPGDALMPGEIACPASAEAGKRTTCAQCGLCDGKRGANDRRKSIAIVDHGPTSPTGNVSVA